MTERPATPLLFLSLKKALKSKDPSDPEDKSYLSTFQELEMVNLLSQLVELGKDAEDLLEEIASDLPDGAKPSKEVPEKEEDLEKSLHIEPLKKAWSEEARQAAAEARKGSGEGPGEEQPSNREQLKADAQKKGDEAARKGTGKSPEAQEQHQKTVNEVFDKFGGKKGMHGPVVFDRKDGDKIAPFFESKGYKVKTLYDTTSSSGRRTVSMTATKRGQGKVRIHLDAERAVMHI
jgi:hypothetical protein